MCTQSKHGRCYCNMPLPFCATVICRVCIINLNWKGCERWHFHVFRIRRVSSHPHRVPLCVCVCVDCLLSWMELLSWEEKLPPNGPNTFIHSEHQHTHTHMNIIVAIKAAETTATASATRRDATCFSHTVINIIFYSNKNSRISMLWIIILLIYIHIMSYGSATYYYMKATRTHPNTDVCEFVFLFFSSVLWRRFASIRNGIVGDEFEHNRLFGDRIVISCLRGVDTFGPTSANRRAKWLKCVINNKNHQRVRVFQWISILFFFFGSQVKICRRSIEFEKLIITNHSPLPCSTVSCSMADALGSDYAWW